MLRPNQRMLLRHNFKIQPSDVTTADEGVVIQVALSIHDQSSWKGAVAPAFEGGQKGIPSIDCELVSSRRQREV